MNRAWLLLGAGILGCGSSSGDDGLVAGAGGRGGAGQAGQGGAATGGTAAGGAATGGTAAGGTAGAPSCTGPSTTTDGVACTYAHDALNADPSVKTNSTVAWKCSGATRSMTSNGVPDHAVGTFPNPNCPNAIAPQTVSASVTLSPVDKGSASKLAIVGYALNGVKFDPATAGTCSVSGSGASCSLIGNTGTWNIEALGQSSFSFGDDQNKAHVQPGGAYHYHGIPEGLLSNLGKGATPTLVGFALDGFPVYARYGYANPTDGGSQVKTLTSSYKLKATPDAGRPSVSTYPLGTFTQDYEYVAGSGDLDECNGRFAVTPDFPCGIYHYTITDTYPFIQRCVKGTPNGGGMMGMGGMGGGGMTGMGGMTGNPPACAPGQTSMCCGDGKCDGPETAGNCPADCP